MRFDNYHQLSGDYNEVQELILRFIEEHGQGVTLFEKYSETPYKKINKYPKPLQKS